MKKTVSIVLICLIIMAGVPKNYAWAEESLELESKSVVLLEASSGEVLYEKNTTERRIPASVTKLMTLLLLFEAVDKGEASLSDTVTASAYAASMGGTQIFLAQGEKMSLKELAIALAVGSANDAAVAISEYLAGSEEAFVRKMNDKAQELGMNDTHFANPNGLPAEEHYTTAADLGVLARTIVNDYPEILEYTSLKNYTLRENTKPFVLDNKNKLLWWCEGADGLKTGWIGADSGYNVSATAARNGMRLIVIALGAEKTYGNFRDSIKLFDYGFNNYRYERLYHKNEPLANCSIEKGELLSVNAVSPIEIGLVLAQNQTDFSSEIVFHDLCAPIETGEEIGEIEVYINGEINQKYPLYAAENVEKYGFFQALTRAFYYLLT